MDENLLYYGDNLQVLRLYIKDESVDLIYLDPPFKSEQTYNVLFEEQNGRRSEAQVQAFTDTWRWDRASSEAFDETVRAGSRTADALVAFKTFLGPSDMLAYLSMMAPRLKELHRVLKPTGTIYLHCDSTASHYLKMLMDSVFGPQNFRNEIIWRRSHPHGNVSRSYGSIHDTILFYSKTDDYRWNRPHKSYFLPDGSLDPEVVEEVLKQYSMVEAETGRRFQATSLLNPNPDRPNLTYEFHEKVKVWRWTRERMERAEREGRLYFPKGGDGIPREKRYLDEQEGFPLQDMWIDVPPISPQAAERLGYPTQKPEALLDRIIRTSSVAGDTVLDPFCGCGTTIAVAQRLNRRWIGIDITHLAISLIRYRLRDSYGREARFRVLGEPADLASAQMLAKENPYQFQFWALSLVGARPSPTERKKGSDRGIDGRIYFQETPRGETKTIVLQVKSGHVGSPVVRDLRGVLERERGAIGGLIILDAPTREMRKEAAEAGLYTPEYPLSQEESYPRIQILSVANLLEGTARLEYPRMRDVTFRKAPKAISRRRGRNSQLAQWRGAGRGTPADGDPSQEDK